MSPLILYQKSQSIVSAQWQQVHKILINCISYNDPMKGNIANIVPLIFYLLLPSFDNSIRFHLFSFTYYLTLSSEFFSTFPHGTCLLSDSYIYLALGEVYHLLWAVFPNNPTQSIKQMQYIKNLYRSITFYRTLVKENLRNYIKHNVKCYTLQFAIPLQHRDSALSSSRFTRSYFRNPI